MIRTRLGMYIMVRQPTRAQPTQSALPILRIPTRSPARLDLMRHLPVPTVGTANCEDLQSSLDRETPSQQSSRSKEPIRLHTGWQCSENAYGYSLLEQARLALDRNSRRFLGRQGPIRPVRPEAPLVRRARPDSNRLDRHDMPPSNSPPAPQAQRRVCSLAGHARPSNIAHCVKPEQNNAPCPLAPQIGSHTNPDPINSTPFHIGPNIRSRTFGGRGRLPDHTPAPGQGIPMTRYSSTT